MLSILPLTLPGSCPLLPSLANKFAVSSISPVKAPRESRRPRRCGGLPPSGSRTPFHTECRPVARSRRARTERGESVSASTCRPDTGKIRPPSELIYSQWAEPVWTNWQEKINRRRQRLTPEIGRDTLTHYSFRHDFIERCNASMPAEEVATLAGPLRRLQQGVLRSPEHAHQLQVRPSPARTRDRGDAPRARRLRRRIRRAVHDRPFPVPAARAAGKIVSANVDEAEEQVDETQGRLNSKSPAKPPDSRRKAGIGGFPNPNAIARSAVPVSKTYRRQAGIPRLQEAISRAAHAKIQPA